MSGARRNQRDGVPLLERHVADHPRDRARTGEERERRDTIHQTEPVITPRLRFVESPCLARLESGGHPAVM